MRGAGFVHPLFLQESGFDIFSRQDFIKIGQIRICKCIIFTAGILDMIVKIRNVY